MAMPFLYQGDTAPLLAKTDPDNAYAEESQIKAQLAEEGAVLFRGLGIQSAEAFDRFSYQFGYRDFSYQASCLTRCALTHATRLPPTRRPKRLKSFCTMKWLRRPCRRTNYFLLSFGFRIGRRDTPLQE